MFADNLPKNFFVGWCKLKLPTTTTNEWKLKTFTQSILFNVMFTQNFLDGWRILNCEQSNFLAVTRKQKFHQVHKVISVFGGWQVLHENHG